jgi:hypothetical protein
MDEQTRQQAFVSALVTEHFVLQSARSTTVTEANGRAAIYLTSVSSALVAFGFVAQVANQLDPFMAAVLPALFVLGVFTFIRLVENSIENLVFLEQIQRIRGYYAGLVPEARAFFASGTGTPPGPRAGAGVDDTEAGEMATALASTGMGASRVEMLFTAASMVAAVNSILGGVAGSPCWWYGRSASTPPGRCWSGWWPPWWYSGCTLSGRAGEATRPWGGARRAPARVVGRSDGCTPQVKVHSGTGQARREFPQPHDPDGRPCLPTHRPDPIPAFQPLLERLDLTDVVVTADALQTHPDAAEFLITHKHARTCSCSRPTSPPCWTAASVCPCATSPPLTAPTTAATAASRSAASRRSRSATSASPTPPRSCRPPARPATLPPTPGGSRP